MSNRLLQPKLTEGPEAARGAPRLFAGDRLDLEVDKDGTLLVRRGEKLIGTLPADAHSFGPEGADPELCAATVGAPGIYGLDRAGDLIVRIEPFPMLACGCVVNLGGWLVAPCEKHAEERAARAAAAEPCEHGVMPDEACSTCEREALASIAEDRREAERSWGR